MVLSVEGNVLALHMRNGQIKCAFMPKATIYSSSALLKGLWGPLVIFTRMLRAAIWLIKAMVNKAGTTVALSATSHCGWRDKGLAGRMLCISALKYTLIYSSLFTFVLGRSMRTVFRLPFENLEGAPSPLTSSLDLRAWTVLEQFKETKRTF